MFEVVLGVSVSPSSGSLVRGNRSDRGSHVVSHNFFFRFFCSNVFKQNLYGSFFGQGNTQWKARMNYVYLHKLVDNAPKHV